MTKPQEAVESWFGLRQRRCRRQSPGLRCSRCGENASKYGAYEGQPARSAVNNGPDEHRGGMYEISFGA
jgi:hypothetical protein